MNDDIVEEGVLLNDDIVEEGELLNDDCLVEGVLSSDDIVGEGLLSNDDSLAEGVSSNDTKMDFFEEGIGLPHYLYRRSFQYCRSWRSSKLFLLGLYFVFALSLLASQVEANSKPEI